ncbi:hypothetical protein Tco_0048919 [Tanacetum coccineum]
MRISSSQRMTESKSEQISLYTPLNPTNDDEEEETNSTSSYWRFTKNDFFPEPSFQNFTSYTSALSQTVYRFRDRFFGRSSDGNELIQLKKQSENEMSKCLTWVDLVWLGFGSVVGSGIFTITGLEARDHAVLDYGSWMRTTTRSV